MEEYDFEAWTTIADGRDASSMLSPESLSCESLSPSLSPSCLSPPFYALPSTYTPASDTTETSFSSSSSTSSIESRAPSHTYCLVGTPIPSLVNVTTPRPIAPAKPPFAATRTVSSSESGIDEPVAKKTRASRIHANDAAAILKRKEERAERNRKSADDSRKRKQADIREMHRQIEHLTIENAALNAKLEGIYSALAANNIQLIETCDESPLPSPTTSTYSTQSYSTPSYSTPSYSSHTTYRKPVALCALMLCCSLVMFNATYTPANLQGAPSSSVGVYDNVTQHHHNRVMLDETNATLANVTSMPSSECQFRVNSTQSHRNHKAINTWAQHNKKRVPLVNLDRDRLCVSPLSRSPHRFHGGELVLREANTYYVIARDATVLPPTHMNVNGTGWLP